MTNSVCPSSRRRWRLAVAACAVAVLGAACSGNQPHAEVASFVDGAGSPDRVPGNGDGAAERGERAEATAKAVRERADVALGDSIGFVLDTAEVFERSDGTVEIAGTVGLPIGEGDDLPLEDAELIIGQDPITGEDTIVGGRSRIPFPDSGVLAGIVVNHVPVGDMGVAYGRDLHHLGAHLRDDVQYMYWHFDGGLDVDIPGAGEPGMEALPPKIAVPTGVSATFVLDPADPYFYVGTVCPDLSDKDENDDAKDGGGDGNDEGGGSTDDRSVNSDEDRSRRQADDPDGDVEHDVAGEDGEEDEDALYTLEPTDLPPGEDCGIGFSLGGHIPGRTMGVDTGFSGHVVVDGIIPLYAGVELDGTAVLSVGANGAHTAGWGDVIATVPLIDSLIDIAIPLAEAGVEVELEGDRIGLAYEGSVAADDPTYELPLLGIPITLPAAGSAQWSARFGFVNDGAGTFEVDPTSFVDIRGQMSMGLGRFGELVGIELTDVQASEAALRIDRDGVRMVGSSLMQIHPALETSGAADFDLYVSAGDLGESYLRFATDVELLGHRLAGANIDLSESGLFINGRLDVGALEVDMAGAIDRNGINVRGATAVEFPTSQLSEFSADAVAAIEDAQRSVDQVDDDIDAMRRTVRDERRARSSDFQAAKAFLDTAIADLAKIDANIAENDRLIRINRDKINAEKARFDRLSLGQQILEGTWHAAQIAGWETAIAGLTTANATQIGYQVTARKTLEGAQSALDLIDQGLNAVPIDTDPRIIALFAARETATLALSAAKAGAELLDIDLDVDVRGEIELVIGTDGLGGAVTAEVCGDDGCETLAGGELFLGSDPKACVSFFGLGDLCLPL